MRSKYIRSLALLLCAALLGCLLAACSGLSLIHISEPTRRS